MAFRRLSLALGALALRLGSAGDEVDADAVDVNVYYETDCPYSQQFIIDEVKPLIDQPNCLAPRVRFHWYAYGMATRDAAGNMNCQHGEDECKGNRVQLCAKQKFGTNARGLTKFIVCHEIEIRDNKMPADDATSVEKCAAEAGFAGQGAELISCSQGSTSVQLAQAAGVETDSKKPALVPFANFVGQPELQDYNLFTGGVPNALQNAICGQLRETNKPFPDCCNQFAGRRLGQKDLVV